MTAKIFFGVIVILVITQVNLSCKKEFSCEGCKESKENSGKNKPPIAIAGLDLSVTLPADSILLDGSASNDPDGMISEWLWTKISGPASFIILKINDSITLVKNLVAGTYQFELNVKDNEGLSARDTMQVIVNNASQTNRPPVADAGSDETIILPVNSIVANGNNSSDPDNNIVSYAWTKISGPASFSISNANGVQTQVTSLVQGVYQFELKVTDAGGLFSKDTMQVTVINQPPLCTSCKIAFVSDRDGNAEIYTSGINGSNIQRLTYDIGTDEEPTWSPDGTKIAFMSNRTGHYEIYVMNADGTNVMRKTFHENYAQDPSWSPDGTKIAYATVSNGSLNIWVMNVTNGSPTLLFAAPGWDGRPAWSPDGTKIALVSDWMAYDIVFDIYTINSDGSGFTGLTGNNIFDNLDYLNPSWSPGGTKLAMAISQTVGVDQYNTQIGVMNADGSGITAIRAGAAAWSRTSWSGDGTRIAYTSMSGSGTDVSWVSADGSAYGIIVSDGRNADWQR